MRAARTRTAIAALAAFAMLTTACGDDDDESTAVGDDAPQGETASAEEFCAASAELDSGDGPPTAEQFEELKTLAPDEISADVELAADAFIEADGDFGAAMAVDGVEDAIGALEEWEGENCESDFVVAPELVEYCEKVEELDSQDGPPTEEQLLEFKELRPDEIGEDTDLVVDAFVAAEGDIGQVFSDPAIGEALERMEAFDAENCGLEDGDEGDEEMATEPMEGAEVVDITGVDFAFEGVPSDIAAGPVSLKFINGGPSAHEMVVFKLADGVDLDALLASDEEPSDDEITEVGGVFGQEGDGPYYVNAELEPGTYAMVCFIPGPESKPHYELGMKSTFTVS